MSLEDDIAQSLAEKMAKEIDKELLDDMMIAVLKDEGWIKTTVNPAYTDMGMLSGRYEQWYVIQVEPRVVPWVREQNQELWYEHLTCNQRYRVLDTFDVHEKLYTMLAMRWA